MANLTYAAETVLPGRSTVSAFRRLIGQWQAFRARLAEDSAAQRQDHRLRRLVRRMDRRQLQDIGLDRNRC
jgi:uncharacterized protein YjiS (DUF1127 family)